MVHHNQWGWRGAARRLLLAPLAAGVVMTAAGPAWAQAPARQVAPRNADPTQLLKDGRAALKGGQFDRAQDLAKQAEANNSSGRWSLFGDTPEALEKDVTKARARAAKAEAEKLTAQAKALYAKAAKTAGERIANLDQAYAMADKAMTLAGPADFFDDLFGDRPDKLKKDIDAARVAVRKANPGVLTAAATTRQSGSGVRQVQATGRDFKTGMPPVPNMPTPGAASAQDRTQAVKLVADGRERLKEGKLVEAKACVAKAMTYNVPFAPTADSPETLGRDVMSAGKVQVDRLTQDASGRASQRDYARAESNLAEARTLAVGLGLPTRGIDEQMMATRKASGEPVAMAAGITLPSATTAAPEMPAAPAMPALKLPGMGGDPTPVAVTMPTATPVRQDGMSGGTLTSAQLLTQANNSLKADDLPMARKLAAQALNLPTATAADKAEAAAVMRDIDAETSNKSRSEAVAAFNNAASSHQAGQHETAAATLRLIDPMLLPANLKPKYVEMVKAVDAEQAKVTQAQAPMTAPTTMKPATPSLTEAARSAEMAEFAQLRTEGLQAEAKARETYQRGDTDVAIQMLTDFGNKVRASKLAPARQQLLLTSVELRLDNFRVMKRQTDFYRDEATAKTEGRTRVASKQLAADQTQGEIKRKATEVAELVKRKQFRKAEELALQLKTLSPDDPTLSAMYEMAKRQRRADEYSKLKGEKEEFNLQLLNSTEGTGPVMTDAMPLHVDPVAAAKARLRGDGSSLYQKPLSDAEREIEVKLERPVTVRYESKPLREVLSSLRKQSGLNITTDDAAIQDAQIPLDLPITEELHDLSLRSVLTVLLDKARLKFIIENNVVKVTTEKRAQGKLYTKVFSVMELVTPIPDFALAPHQTFANAMKGNNSAPAWQQSGPGASAYNPTGGFRQQGELVSGQLPGAAGPAGGTLQSQNQASPLADSATLAKNGRTNHSAQLMKLIQAVVKPYTWSDQGGSGAINYYDIGGALVVNQTADVIGEVQNLLESLRRLQEVSVSVEIRVVSLSEAFYERIGVDFSLNVKTKNTANFERSLTTGQFRPEPFINDINVRNVTVGYNPTAGGFTSDLDFPVRTNSFGLGVPPFGGYPGPGNGGLGIGLAFLNDIQVFMFMEASAGDRRVNVMQAPKITLFNGQTATVFVSDFAFFTTGLDVVNVGGQFVYIPRNTPIPIGNSNAPPGVQQQNIPGVTVTVQAIVSSDRRFVRLNLAPTLTALTSAVVPLFPVTAFITPVFEGGSQGVPIPFTQFFQQPSISEINVQTTVQCPDGGTVVLGGLKTLSEGRNEFGPPVLSQLPYVNRLFRNQGIGRETRHIMIMVTPRIIIQSEEELSQTGSTVSLPGVGNPP